MGCSKSELDWDSDTQPSGGETSGSSEDDEAANPGQCKGDRVKGTESTWLTKQQTSDLAAAHLRWGHRSFRKCAHIMGIPAPEKTPFCEACVEAKATRYPRRPRGLPPITVREPAPRPGYRLFFDPIGPFKEATLHRYKYALIVLDDFSGLLQTRLMVRLSEWFVHLSGLVKRIEAEKGSERVGQKTTYTLVLVQVHAP